MRVLAALGLVASLLSAGSIVKTIRFETADITIETNREFDIVRIPGCLYTSHPGNPSLPELSYSLLVPPTAEVTGIEVISYQIKDIPGSFNIFPAQPALPLSEIPGAAFVGPNPAVYSSNAPYPGKLASFVPTGCMSGYRIAGVFVYPVQYIPAEQKLRFYTELTVKLTYEEGRHERVVLSKSQVEVFGEDVQRLVLNPEDVIPWRPSTRAMPRDSCDYLIITDPAFVTDLEPLAYWRTKKGYYTKIVGTDSIYPRYPGRDNAEKVRNCVRDYWQTKGIKWVLLAGDIAEVPLRTCYATVGGTSEYIPCDLYFADMQWSYDGNRNNIFGEFPFNGDTVDLYQDVYLGRASIDAVSQATVFVGKVSTYEKAPDPDYMVRMLLCTGISDNTINDSIGRIPPVPLWTTIKLYASLGNLNRGSCTDTLRAGVGFVNHVSAGDENGFLNYHNSVDACSLDNMLKFAIGTAITRRIGAFDLGTVNGDCYAENFMNAPIGGAVAGIFNSREGWMNTSEHFNYSFYQCFFNRDSLFEIGRCHAVSKAVYRNNAFNQPAWRWCYYELNLLGDPELPMWSTRPQAMEVSHPDPVPVGLQTYPVLVRSGGNPLANALVCLWKDDEVYARARTDASGNAVLAINPATSGVMLVTVSAKDHLPYESSCTVGIAEGRGESIRSAGVRMLNTVAAWSLKIEYDLPGTGRLEAVLYSVTGRAARSVVPRTVAGHGLMELSVRGLAAGVYFADISINGRRLVRQKVVVVP